ncbi:MAG: LytTR family transcriptional regulator DNA-binding domain-containing protein [Cyclobacteriaceae bacterium]|nr:LytTR family transcriptional regulator DNA-binding domain-containing protein [Cyclobacteriaceae bacterium]
MDIPFQWMEPWRHRLWYVLFLGAYTLVFINLYHPFNINRWYSGSDLPIYLILSTHSLIAISTLLFSQFFIRRIFRVRLLTFSRFIVWCLFEVFLLSFVFALIYGDIRPDLVHMLNEFRVSFKYTALVAVIPLLGLILYFFVSLRKPEFSQVVYPDRNLELLKIYDEKGEVQVSVLPSLLLFLKSADNYVEIYFLKQGKVKKELIRTSLKRLENDMEKINVLRCHRSYMVNTGKVSLLQRTSKGLMIEIEGYSEALIPVSRSYQEAFSRWMA